jgi:hypothetical protein
MLEAAGRDTGLRRLRAPACRNQRSRLWGVPREDASHRDRPWHHIAMTPPRFDYTDGRGLQHMIGTKRGRLALDVS